MYVSYGTVTILNSIIRDNTAGNGGGVFVWSGTADIYGTTFSSNTASTSSSGPDIYRRDGTVTVYGCEAGWYSTQGAALSTFGTIGGTPYSYSCTPCSSRSTNASRVHITR